MNTCSSLPSWLYVAVLRGKALEGREQTLTSPSCMTAKGLVSYLLRPAAVLPHPAQCKGFGQVGCSPFCARQMMAEPCHLWLSVAVHQAKHQKAEANGFPTQLHEHQGRNCVLQPAAVLCGAALWKYSAKQLDCSPFCSGQGFAKPCPLDCPLRQCSRHTTRRLKRSTYQPSCVSTEGLINCMFQPAAVLPATALCGEPSRPP